MPGRGKEAVEFLDAEHPGEPWAISAGWRVAGAVGPSASRGSRHTRSGSPRRRRYMYSRPTGVRLKGDGDRPTVSPAKNSLVYFLSIAYIDRPVWRSHPEEAKRRPPSGHRIPRNAGAMMSLLLPSATTRGSLIAGWCVIGAPPRGQPRTPVWWTFRRPCMGRPVPCELLRNEWLDAITIVPVTAYHRRSHNAPAKRGA